MRTFIRAESTGPCSVRRLGRVVGVIGGGVVLQTAGGCQEYWSSVVDALGQPVATGIGNGLSDLVQALVIGLFV